MKKKEQDSGYNALTDLHNVLQKQLEEEKPLRKYNIELLQQIDKECPLDDKLVNLFNLINEHDSHMRKLMGQSSYIPTNEQADALSDLIIDIRKTLKLHWN